jgi:RNA polymerase sigma-54 factor
MALSAKLMLRQGHALVMTPQLLQAIKLLQFSNVELSAFVEAEIEKNPLLERADERGDSEEASPSGSDDGEGGDEDSGEASPDWSSDELVADQRSLELDLGTELDNSFGGEPAASTSNSGPAPEPGSPWTASGGSSGGQAANGEEYNLESFVAARPSLREHLGRQLGLAAPDGVDQAIGQAIVDSIDETGYLVDSLEDLAARLGVAPGRAERVLAIVQGFEPAGVGARNLAECLAIQLKERDRFDPAMQALVAHLPLLARRDFAALEKICQVDAEDLAEMAAEIRCLDPKPGRAFGGAPLQTVVPDVIAKPAADGTWRIELNPETLPRVLVNQSYAVQIAARASSSEDKTFIAGCLQDANWLTKSLDQRARTILKVASEIVRQQDAFFTYGVEHLRPLNLKMIADAVRMHESTVSRVTSNKFLGSPRGLFELKYFFSASIASKTGAEAHSAESVRYRIKQLIDQENPKAVLSDDAIVAKLRAANVDIARRTVAKYRESMRIPSSVERRREKLANV